MCNGHKYLSFLKIIAVFANAGPDVCKCRLFSHHRVKHFHQVKNRACLREAEKKLHTPTPPFVSGYANKTFFFTPTLKPDDFALMKLIFDLIFFSNIIWDSQADPNQKLSHSLCK